MSDSSLKTYLDSIGKYPLLTATDEIQLSRQIQAMIALQVDKPEGPYSLPEKRIIRRGEQAKAKMISCNLRLVVSVARKYSKSARTMDILDLIQEGSIGLSRAAEKFDHERGYKFSTYSYWWIRQGITRAINMQDRTIRLPVSANDTLRQARTFALNEYERTGQKPSLKAMANHCGIKEETLRDFLHHANDCRSLDAPSQTFKDEVGSLHELISCDRQAGFDQLVEDSNVEWVQNGLALMPDDQAHIVREIFGLDGCERAMSDIAKEMSISRDKVRVIRDTSLNRLRLNLVKAQPKKYQSQSIPSNLSWKLGRREMAKL